MNQKQVAKLVDSVRRYHGGAVPLASEADVVVAWASATQMEAELLRLVFKGTLYIGSEDGDLVFRLPDDKELGPNPFPGMVATVTRADDLPPVAK